MNPLELRGPEFLSFYVSYLAVVLAAAFVLRALVAHVLVPGPDARDWAPGRYPKESQVYHIAFLRGGAQEVVRAVLARLVAAELLDLGDKRIARRADAAADGRLSALERTALAALGKGAEARGAFTAVGAAVAGDIGRIEQDLVRDGLLRAGWDRFAPWLVHLLSTIAGPGLGIAKIVVGVRRSRPVLFLVLLTGLAWVVFALVLRTSRRTRAGERYLAWLRESHRGLRDLVLAGRRASGGEIALCSAIFGLAALAALPHVGRLRTALRPSGAMGSASATCGSGCASCGGGGGGCGGGGCGGCGGCGG